VLKGKKSQAQASAPAGEITKRASNLLSKSPKVLTVGTLEEALLRQFPADTAETWDKTGLIVGERAQLVGKVAVALDPTVEAIKQAAAIGANVLVTHHPPFINNPGTFEPAPSSAANPGAAVWAAITNRVALMCYHTACDVSAPGQMALCAMLGLEHKGKVVCPVEGHKNLGYGTLCRVPLAQNAEGVTLATLSARALSTFGRPPRVWGDPDAEITTVVCSGGSASGVWRAALEAGAQVLVTGEMGYHNALDAAAAGMATIELGHDVSELPLCAVLAEALSRAGVEQDNIKLLDQSNNWWTPEAIRL
jgi:putative NIF3 family GTP cyclohydrolase 1 type 2